MTSTTTKRRRKAPRKTTKPVVITWKDVPQSLTGDLYRIADYHHGGRIVWRTDKHGAFITIDTGKSWGPKG